RLRLVARPRVVAVLVDAETLILVQEFAPQQPARILPDAPQPLFRGLIRRPALELFAADRLAFAFRLLGCRLVGLGLRVRLAVVGRLAVGARDLLLAAVALLAVVARLALGGRRLRAVPSLLRLPVAGIAVLGLLRRLAGLALALPFLLLLSCGLLLFRRRRILREQLLEQVAVEARVLVLRIELERAIVRLDRSLDLSGARKRRAAVVVRVRSIEPGKRRRARCVIAGAVVRGRAPLRILEQARRPLGPLVGHRLHAALIGTAP